MPVNPTNQHEESDSARTLVVHRGRELREVVHRQRLARRRVGLVPTMGALHEGHLSLVRAAREECDCVVVTIFVNPTQFAPSEDLEKYPRTFPSDLDALAGLDVEWVFVPSVEEMYPDGFSTYVAPPDLARRWEGECRPGHFRGVTTVVLKLFHLAPADVAFFGQKDYQQLQVIRRMTRDLSVPMEIRMCPIIRERDGLAMSSRNRYLTDAERKRALALSASLERARDMVAGGVREARLIAEAIRKELAEAGIHEIDYVAIADPDSLEPLDDLQRNAVALVAATVGSTRLIDNCLLPVEERCSAR